MRNIRIIIPTIPESSSTLWNERNRHPVRFVRFLPSCKSVIYAFFNFLTFLQCLQCLQSLQSLGIVESTVIYEALRHVRTWISSSLQRFVPFCLSASLRFCCFALCYCHFFGVHLLRLQCFCLVGGRQRVFLESATSYFHCRDGHDHDDCHRHWMARHRKTDCSDHTILTKHFFL